MASRFELEVQLREAFGKVFPKPVGKMKKHEIEHTLEAFQSWQADKAKTPEPAPKPPRIPRKVSALATTVADMTVSVPTVPPARVTGRSTLAEKAAARAEHELPTHNIITAPPTRGRKKVTIAAEVPAGGAGLPPAPVEDVDPRASRIVKAHKAASATVADPTLPKKPHRCNCPYCDKRGMTA